MYFCQKIIGFYCQLDLIYCLVWCFHHSVFTTLRQAFLNICSSVLWSVVRVLEKGVIKNAREATFFYLVESAADTSVSQHALPPPSTLNPFIAFRVLVVVGQQCINRTTICAGPIPYISCKRESNIGAPWGLFWVFQDEMYKCSNPEFSDEELLTRTFVAFSEERFS